MNILKLILVTLFLYFSSKSFGIFLKNNLKIKDSISLGLGYLSNIALFFVCLFPVMVFKLSSSWMMIFGSFYLIITLFFMYKSSITYELFKFSKKEIISILIAILFLILYAIFIDFGYAEMYDSYFYSILTNSASNVNHISKINPYTGIGDLQNFYKYISFYYQASFFANLLNIKPAYLVLIWAFTFMNYFMLATTAFGIVRISKHKYINNILSIFILTLYTSFFRAPFNALHMVNLIIPIYMLKFIFDSFKDDKNIKIYYILFIAAAACSSTILYVSATLILLLFIVMSLNKKTNFNLIFKLAIPTYCLGVIYLMENFKNPLWLLLFISILFIIYYLLKLKVINILCKIVGRVCLVLVPLTFIIIPTKPELVEFINLFIGQGAVEDKLVTTANSYCIEDVVELKKLDLKIDNNRYGTAMKYIYENSSSKINTLLILITHSVFMYGGMLFFVIYGFFKLRDKNRYKAFWVYLILYFNPFVSKGLALLTMDLNARIYLFFNTYFSLCGLICFFKFIKHFNWNWLNKLLKYTYIPYFILLCLSLTTYIMLLKVPDWKNNSFLYKVPKNLVASSIDVDKITSIGHKKSNVLYTTDVLNLTMIDTNPNNEYKVIDSKEYKSYYFTPEIINNKMLMNLFFETDGVYTYDYLSTKIKKISGNINIDNCDIKSLLKEYRINYIVMKSNNKNIVNNLKDDFYVKYNKNDIIVLGRRSEI